MEEPKIPWDELPRDTIVYLSLIMDIPEILTLCNVHPNFNKYVCRSQNFWMNKILIDFPEYKSKIKYYGPNYKQTYRNIAYGRLEINVTLNYTREIDENDLPLDNSDQNYEEEYVEISNGLIYHNKISDQDLRDKVYDILSDLFHETYLFGIYTISIDGIDIAVDKYFSKEYLKALTKDSKSLSIYFYSHERLDMTNDELQKLWNSSAGIEPDNEIY